MVSRHYSVIAYSAGTDKNAFIKHQVCCMRTINQRFRVIVS